MVRKRDGGPVYPQPERSPDPDAPDDEQGLKLRDYFAGQALTALVTSALALDHRSWDATAQHAYYIADAMIAERVKP